jgi:hypothetical protein
MRQSVLWNIQIFVKAPGFSCSKSRYNPIP